MARFGVDQTQIAQTEAHDQVREGVSREPFALQGLASIFSDVGEAVAQGRQSRQQAFVSDFTNKQLAIIQALDQGVAGYNSRFARTKMRSNLMSAIETHPGLREELLKANSTLLGQAGMGDIVTNGTKEEIRRDSLRNDLFNGGYISDINASDLEIDYAQRELAMSNAADESYRREAAEIDAELKRHDLSSSRRSELQAQKKASAERTVVNMAPSALNQLNTFVNNLLNNPEMSMAEKRQSLEQYKINMNAGFSEYQAEINDSNKFKAMTSFLDDSVKLAEQLITGEITQDSYDRERALTTSMIQSRALEDPAIANAVALDGLFKTLHPATSADIMRKTAEWYNQQLDTNEPAKSLYTEDRKTAGTYFSTVFDMVPSTPEEEEEQRTHFERSMESLEDYEAVIRKDAAKGVAALDWMSSQQFLDLMGRYPDVNTQGATQVLKQNLFSEVYNLVGREFRDANVVRLNQEGGALVSMTGVVSNPATVEENPVQDFVAVQTDSGGVTFVPLSDDQNMVDLAARLNKQVKPIVNQAIRAGAHLEGRSDYAVVAQESMDLLFGGQAAQGSEDVEDDLTTEDFLKTNADSAQRLLKAIDTTESGGDYGALLSFTNRSRFSDVNIKDKTIAELVRFSQPGGEYANFSRAEVGRMATPMGRYQIVGTTLRRVARQMNIDPSTKFDENTQDAMFNFLVQEALEGKRSMSSKVDALRRVWEGFKHLTDEELELAIMEYEDV